MVGFEKSLPILEQIDDNDALDKDMMKSSDEAVEDIEQMLLSLLETGADYEKNVKILLENPEVLEDDVTRLKYAIEAYENLKKIDSQLVDTHTKWVAIKKIVYRIRPHDSVVHTFCFVRNICNYTL